MIDDSWDFKRLYDASMKKLNITWVMLSPIFVMAACVLISLLTDKLLPALIALWAFITMFGICIAIIAYSALAACCMGVGFLIINVLLQPINIWVQRVAWVACVLVAINISVFVVHLGYTSFLGSFQKEAREQDQGKIYRDVTDISSCDNMRVQRTQMQGTKVTVQGTCVQTFDLENTKYGLHCPGDWRWSKVIHTPKILYTYVKDGEFVAAYKCVGTNRETQK